MLPMIRTLNQKRLSGVLIEKGIVKDENEAFVIVTEGRVFVNGQKAVSPAQPVRGESHIEIRGPKEFVSRGGYKLEAAIRRFGVSAAGKVCADVGSASGGFVEVLLAHGAAKVYAIEAGRGKLDLKLREDPRVVVMEGANILAMAALPEAIGLFTIDVSLTRLELVLLNIRKALRADGAVIALFKPQYEVEDKSKLKHGILKDEIIRRELVEQFRAWLREHGWGELGFMESPIRGSEGNVEYLFLLKLHT